MQYFEKCINKRPESVKTQSLSGIFFQGVLNFFDLSSKIVQEVTKSDNQWLNRL